MIIFYKKNNLFSLPICSLFFIVLPKALQEAIKRFLKIAWRELEKAKYSELFEALNTYYLSNTDKYQTLRMIQGLISDNRLLTDSFARMFPDTVAQTESPNNSNRAKNYIAQMMSLGDSTYQTFLSYLSDYKSNIIDKDTLAKNMQELLQGHPRLFEEFKVFLNSNDPKDGDEDDKQNEAVSGLSSRREGEQKHIELRAHPMHRQSLDEHKVSEGLEEDKCLKIIKELATIYGKDFEAICKCILLYTVGIITVKETLSLLEPIMNNNPDSLYQIETILSSREKNRRQYTALCMPLSELRRILLSKYNAPSESLPHNLENIPSKRNGSYHRLPDNYPEIISTGRDPELLDHLNNEYFSVAQGSEDFTVKIMRRSIFEESLHKCEDDRFQVDMALNTLDYAINILESIQAQARHPDYRIPPEVLQSHKLKPIFRLYGDIGHFIKSKMELEPLSTVSLVLGRMVYQRSRCRQYKIEQEKIWKETCEKNLRLDQKAFYFKQKEKKNTNTKIFVCEIKARFLDRFNSHINIQKGGNEYCIYFNSYNKFSPEEYHVQPAPDDDIALMNHEQLRENIDKLPQFQLRFGNNVALAEAIGLILFQIEVFHNSSSEKERIFYIFKQLLEGFMSVPVEYLVESGTFSESEASIALSEAFVKKLPLLRRFTVQQLLDIMKTGEKDAYEEAKKITQKPRRHIRHSEASQPPPKPYPTPLKIEKQKFLPADGLGRQLIFGSQYFFSFFRLLHCLYERLLKARKLIGQFVTNQYSKEALSPEDLTEIAEECYQGIFLRSIRSHLKSLIDSPKYEEFCRTFLGSNGYLLFTLDEVVVSIRKLIQQHLINDEASQKIMELYSERQKNNLEEERYFHNYYYVQGSSTQQRRSLILPQFFHNYNKIVQEFSAIIQQSIFRFLYNPYSRILSIHFFESYYGGEPQILPEMARSISKYVRSSIPSKNQLYNRPIIFLYRNRRKMPCNLFQNSLTHILLSRLLGEKISYGGNQHDLIYRRKRRHPEKGVSNYEFTPSKPVHLRVSSKQSQ